MDVAKIQLSKDELLLVQNAEVLLTKNRIIQKVYEMFGSLIPAIRKLLTEHTGLPAAVVESSPKISRGENYVGLPYVMFDFPRYFSREHIFAIRTMFWWGNFFSVTLHLRGSYKNDIAFSILQNPPAFREDSLSICINDDEWRHDFMDDNYLPVSNATSEFIQKTLCEKEFCKLAAKKSLEEWNEIPKWILRMIENMLHGVNFNFQVDETGL